MCGIIGRIGRTDTVDELLSGLETLEYRGYDSVGVAIKNGHGISVHKQAGQISDVKEEIEAAAPNGTTGIGHTRWSTHGPPTDSNAHPHVSEDGEVAVVHNGVIENYSSIREDLESRGYSFTSETDTEVVPHLIDYRLSRGDEPETAFRTAVDRLDGSYAIAALIGDCDRIYATRAGSPLVIGIDSDRYYLASDVPAFLEYTDRVVFLEDGDVAILDVDGLAITDSAGNHVAREVESVDIDAEETGKGRFDHYMLKEIHSQPNALSNTIEGRFDVGDERIAIDGIDREGLHTVDEVQFVACGTSFHAARFGSWLLGEAGIRAEAHRASEYTCVDNPISGDALVIAVTQSGETADTLEAMRLAGDRGARTIAVTNVTGSTAAREADETVFIRAGPEIGVAATKTFSSQAVTLVLLSQLFAKEIDTASQRDDLRELLTGLEALPDHLDEVIQSGVAKRLARDLLTYEAYFFIGRGLTHPVAMEGALKFKEITYEHAEAFASGQLKHGPLALVTPETPVFALFHGDEAGKTVTNAQEAQTRGADIVGIAPPGHPGLDITDYHLEIPETHSICQGLLANAQLQLVSYHTADRMNRPIDKPRNLAKSVTVE